MSYLGGPARGWALGALLAASVSGLASRTIAAEKAAAAEAAPTSNLVKLVLRGDPLPQAEVRSALAQELGRPVVVGGEAGAEQAAGVVTVSYRKAQAELAVSWDDARGGTVSRVIPARDSEAEVVSDCVLLAGNLARVEAEEVAPTRVPAAVPVAPLLAAPAPKAPSPAAPSLAVVAERPPPETAFATASLFYPIATHYGRPWLRSNLDFNLLYGRVGAIQGSQLGVVNVVRRADGKGSGTMEGLELALLANVVGSDASGLQAAGLFNLVGGDTDGLQLSLGANVSSGPLRGFQVASGFNYAARMQGVQIALVNVAGDVDGAQIGLVNIGGKVRGLAAGLINVADDIDGVPLAPISVTKTGGVHPAFWSGSRGLVNAGLQFATRSTYTMLSGNYHRDFDLDFLGGGVAVGGRIELGAGFFADVSLAGVYLCAPEVSIDEESGSDYHEQLVQARVRGLLRFRLARHFSMFVGPALVGQLRSELGWDRVTGLIGPEIMGGLEF